VAPLSLTLVHGDIPDTQAGVEPSDRELALAYLDGDRDAFAELVRRHQLTVYRVLRRFTRSQDDARDLTQRVFVRALESARRDFPRIAASAEPTATRAWLLRVAINLGKNHVRDRARWPSTRLSLVQPTLASSDSTSARLERAELEALARRAVLELSPRQQEVFSLRIDAELSFAEVGATLGITENNAKAQFHHALKRLKEALASHRDESRGVVP
jgi:RNA polymerase sigma-70 factor (ECF subfamily)